MPEYIYIYIYPIRRFPPLKKDLQEKFERKLERSKYVLNVFINELNTSIISASRYISRYIITTKRRLKIQREISHKFSHRCPSFTSADSFRISFIRIFPC